MDTGDFGSEEYTVEELLLIIEGLDKKIWSLDHVGMANSHPRKLAFKMVRTRTIAKIGYLKKQKEEADASRKLAADGVRGNAGGSSV